jgi:hypothetical protein
MTSNKVVSFLKTRKPSLPRPILQDIYTATIMPFRKLSTTFSTRMLNILKRGHQVRDTAKAATEAKNSSPATMKKKSTTNLMIHNGIPESNLLRSSTANRLHTSHLPLSTNRTVNRTRRRLDTVQRNGRGIPTGMAGRRVELLRLARPLELCLCLCLGVRVLRQGLACVCLLGRSSH